MDQVDKSAVSDTEGPLRREYFAFAGTGSEYFRIWIVNLLLTVVTLGIYSPWAKVRRLKYIYGSTTLDAGRFDYHANPLTIMWGRGIALAVLLLTSVAQASFPLLVPILFVAILALIPLLIVRARMFNMRYTSYRNVRFGFVPAYGAASMAILWYGFLAIISFGLAAPYAHYQRNRFIITHTRFGTLPFTFGEVAGGFFFAYFLTFIVAAIIVTPLLTFLGTGALGGIDFAGDVLSLATRIVPVVILLLGYYVLGLFLSAAVLKTTLNGTDIGATTAAEAPYGLRCDWSLNTLLFMYLVNAIAIIVSLGLLLPWTQMRVLRYQLSHTWIETRTGLATVAADESREVSALGEELGSVFDVDIGL